MDSYNKRREELLGRKNPQKRTPVREAFSQRSNQSEEEDKSQENGGEPGDAHPDRCRERLNEMLKRHETKVNLTQ